MNKENKDGNEISIDLGATDRSQALLKRLTNYDIYAPQIDFIRAVLQGAFQQLSPEEKEQLKTTLERGVCEHQSCYSSLDSESDGRLKKNYIDGLEQMKGIYQNLNQLMHQSGNVL